MRINWSDWAALELVTRDSLCRGEERQLTDEEVADVNRRIAEAGAVLAPVVALFKAARTRFAGR